MASISVYLRNGDFITLGCELDVANSAYNAFVNAEDDFVSLGVLESFPRFAFRIADVVAVVVDPMDTKTVFYASSAVRNAELQSRIPPQLPATPASPPPEMAPQLTSEENQSQPAVYRNANDLLAAFVAELVFCRIRIRAILRILGDAVDRAAFDAALIEIEATDREPLTQQILLTEDSFQRIYAEWIARQSTPTEPQ